MQGIENGGSAQWAEGSSFLLNRVLSLAMPGQVQAND
jgi:hypothetical protein